MKRILTLCLLLCSISVAGAEWQERQCEICGKTVWVWASFDEVSDYGYWQTIPCPGDESITMVAIAGGQVCFDCWDKYQPQLNVLVDSVYVKWLEKAKAENVDARKEKELKEKIEQIKKLIDEIDKGFGGVNYFYHDGTIITNNFIGCDFTAMDSFLTGRKDEIVIDTTAIESLKFHEFEVE